jgi:Lysyl oxidase
VLVGAAAVALVAAGGATVAVAAPPAKEPALKLVTASSAVTLDRWQGEPGEPSSVDLDLGAHIVAGKTPFEMRVTRKSYGVPIVATQVIRQGRTTRTRNLPAGLVKDFRGLPKFLHVTLTDATGKKVVERDQSFCPNGETSRSRPGAPDRNPYPQGCPMNPFTVGSVWGIQAGWAVNTYGMGTSVDIPDGKYTAKISVNERYRDFFGLPASVSTVQVTVRTRTDDGGGPGRPVPGARAHAHGAHSAKPDPKSAARTLRANAARPTGVARVPNVPKPDLRALPAWGIEIAGGDQEEPGQGKDKREYLAFSANVWNAGPATLVVDGFRRPGTDVMDAYQYFYDAKGKQVGHAPTGTMVFDRQPGHFHWHFTDFASYRLLRADQKEVVRSQKEAFCLANTDDIDYTVKNANWRPYNTDLSTACGRESSLSVREVLDVGSGDTYAQFLPGQSFDITDLPNGTYYIQVMANPERSLFEASVKNNVSLRKVILGGTKGARTVNVPPHQLIDAP